MLWVALKDVLLNREYEYLPQFEICNFRNGIVVDLGAHVGLFSLATSVYAKRVLAIEAHPVNYRILEINKIINNVDNITALNKAIVGGDGKDIYIYEGGHSGGSSIYGSGGRAYRVETTTLSEVLNELGYIDL